MRDGMMNPIGENNNGRSLIILTPIGKKGIDV
jgi:hypothetical protein